MNEEQTYMLLASLTASMAQDGDMTAGRRAELLLRRAEIYVALNDLSKALDDLDKAVSLDEALAEAYMLRGQLRFRLRDKNAAFEDLRRAVSVKPQLLANLTGEYKTKEQPKVYKI